MKKFIATLACMVALPAAANAAPFINGSFETGTDPGSFTTLPSGSTTINGWTVGGNSVDYIGSYWNAQSGSRSIDLSGNGLGSISQTFDTVLGQLYQVIFYLGANGDGPPPVKSISVSASGNATGNYSVLSTTNPPNVNYTKFSYAFTAGGPSTTLTFAATGPESPYGAALDSVSVAAVPEPAIWALMIVGFGAIGGVLRRRRQGNFAIA